jgi:hypothetical protein
LIVLVPAIWLYVARPVMPIVSLVAVSAVAENCERVLRPEPRLSMFSEARVMAVPL